MTPENTPYLHLPLDGLRLIEASAGTGKTFTLATLFTRLVVEQHLRMGQILAVTFTEAATQELRGRIRERLELAARLVGGEACADQTQEVALTRSIVERYLADNAHTQTRLQLQARLRLAAEETDLAAIFTIHGFCARMLRDHALESGQSLLDAQLLPQPSALYAQLAADLWRQSGAHPARMEHMLGLWSHPDELALDLPALAGDVPLRPELPTLLLQDPQPELDAAAEHVLATIELELENARKAIDAAFADKTFNGKKARRASFDKAFAELISGGAQKNWPRGESHHVEKLAAKRLAQMCNPGKSPPVSVLFDAVQAWCEMDDQKRQWRNQEKTRLLHALRMEIRQQLRALKQQHNVQTFDDLITELATALHGDNGEHLAARIREHYQFALVDEFQDTDARQWQIFRRIFAAPGRPARLFLIGDPKQAIYGFRGGDVAMYLHAKTQAQLAPSLHENFRSRPVLLKAIERLYAAAGEAAFAGAPIRFEPVLPGGNRRDDACLYDAAPAPALTICELRSADATPLAAEPARQLATRACVAHIHSLLSLARERRALIDERPVEPCDIAILVRRHSDAVRIQQALSEVGIAAVAAGRRSLFASAEALEVRRLLLSLAQPADEGRLRTALSCVLLGLDARTIAALDGDASLQRHWQQRMFGFRERWAQAGIFALLAGICADQAQRLLALNDGERRLTNYLQLAEHLQEASAQVIGLHGLLDWLHARMLQADDHDDTQQLRLESDARCVQILTLHKSKGLEYPLVYLPFVGIETRAHHSARFVEVYEHAQRVLHWKVDPQSDAWRHARDKMEAEQRAESARLLYVGLTRARHALWLAGGALPGLASSPVGPMLKDTAALAGPGIEVTSFAGNTPAPPRLLPQREKGPPPAARMPRRQIAADWWVYSFSQLARMQAGQALPEVALMDAEEQPADDETASVAPLAQVVTDARFSGARFGNALHAALENCTFEAWANWQPGHPAPPAQSECVRTALQQEGWHGEEQDAGVPVLTALVGQTLTTPLPEGGRLSDVPAEFRRAEMEFHFEIKPVAVHELIGLLHAHKIASDRSGFGLRQHLEGLMTGKIDLTYVNNGRWYVLDYKSNQLPGYDQVALREAMKHSQYDLQALIYTLALHRWLRFRLQETYDYQRDFGGVRYLFCRGLGTAGAGIFAERFAPQLVQALDGLLAGQGRGSA